MIVDHKFLCLITNILLYNSNIKVFVKKYCDIRFFFSKYIL